MYARRLWISAVSIDYLLFAIILAGIGLSAVYLRAELLLHRKLNVLRRSRELVQREFHAKRVGLRQTDLPRQPYRVPASIQARPSASCVDRSPRLRTGTSSDPRQSAARRPPHHDPARC